MVATYCNICGRKVGHFGVYVSSGYYAGNYACADIRVTAKEAGAVRRVLESCCRPVHMPVMLRVFVQNPELNYVLSRFLKFGKYEKRCAFRRFLAMKQVALQANIGNAVVSVSMPLRLPDAVTDAILNYLIDL